MGQADRAQQLYQQSLDIAERLAAGEPDNTAYARDLSVSYERLAVLAEESGEITEARQRLDLAAKIRRGLHCREPQRIDRAEELCVTLYLTTVRDGPEDLLREVVDVLVPFDRAGTITAKGRQLLQWARGQG